MAALRLAGSPFETDHADRNTLMKQTLSRYAVFDLDGTLVDSLGDIARALGRVLQKYGRRTISEEATRDLIGKGPRTLMERAWMLTGTPAEIGRAHV